jgi:hypothetical protein
MISSVSSTNPESFIEILRGDRKRGTDPMELLRMPSIEETQHFPRHAQKKRPN